MNIYYRRCSVFSMSLLSTYKKLDSVARITFLLESMRSVFMGIIETSSQSFFLLFMVQVLNAPELSKGIVVAGGSFGLLISPLITQVCGWFMISPSRMGSFFYLVGGFASMLLSTFDEVYAIALLMFLISASWNSIIPLTTQVYADNYPTNVRGALFSVGSIFRILSSAIFAYLLGSLINSDLQNFYFLFYGYAVCFFMSFILMTYVPRENASTQVRSNSLKEGFSALSKDNVFRLTIISWMFMGFGNLLLYPLRVEYLANPKYGIHLTPVDIAMFVSVIPSISRLLCVFMWGVLFDKMNFFTMRIVINIGFIVGVASFFFTKNYIFFFIGSVLYGISTAGGDVAWNLWVTKLAPAGMSKSYMSVHTFFTGIRGIMAPSLSYILLQDYSFLQIAMLSIVLMLIGSILLVGRERL